jgi:hypothetical protein
MRVKKTWWLLSFFGFDYNLELLAFLHVLDVDGEGDRVLFDVIRSHSVKNDGGTYLLGEDQRGDDSERKDEVPHVRVLLSGSTARRPSVFIPYLLDGDASPLVCFS